MVTIDKLMTTTLYNKGKAELLANELNKNDTENWSYKTCESDQKGFYFIMVYDDENYHVGNL